MADSLARILEGVPDVTMESGHSGYFSPPMKTLDPALFNGDRIKPEVAHSLISMLAEFWQGRYAHPEGWSTVWLAGSGISYQWAGDRGNGDLDVLIGVDTTLFKRFNHAFDSWGEVDIDDYLTSELRQNLWPKTANTNFGGKIFEVTLFVNRRARDIRTIHPYAAYNLSTDSWTVRPPKLPSNPANLYPQPWFDAARRDADQARSLAAQFNQAKTTHLMPSLLAEATRLFDAIHTGRQAAFGPQGEGYGDWANFRWQAAKQSGAIGALSQIVDVARKYQAAEDKRLYGGSISSSQGALQTALREVMKESGQ